MGTHPIFESDFDCLTDYISCSNSLEKPSMMFSPKAVKNSPVFHPVVVPPQLPAVLLLLEVPPRKHLRRKSKRNLRAKTKIWDSVFSTKTELRLMPIQCFLLLLL